MRKLLIKPIIFLLIFIFPINVFANNPGSVIIMDVDSGRILYRSNIDEKHLIASTTKIMTCIIVLENSDIEKKITVGDEVLSSYGTNIYIEKGEKIKIIDLLYGLMLRSGNDAAITLAVNTLGLDRFIEKMNERAQKIGMKDTTFENPHGLDDDTVNYSTAYDMALLARYAYKNKMYKKIISCRKYVTKSSKKSYVWYNRMTLMNKYKNCIGGKNGYTPRAGKSLVSYAKKNNFTLLIVSLADNDIYRTHSNLYITYFNKYKKYLIVDKNNFLLLPMLKNKTLYIKRDFEYPLANSEVDNIETLVKIYQKKSKNHVIGKIDILLNKRGIGSLNIYEKTQKKKDKNIFQRITDLFIR